MEKKIPFHSRLAFRFKVCTPNYFENNDLQYFILCSKIHFVTWFVARRHGTLSIQIARFGLQEKYVGGGGWPLYIYSENRLTKIEVLVTLKYFNGCFSAIFSESLFEPPWLIRGVEVALKASSAGILPWNVNISFAACAEWNTSTRINENTTNDDENISFILSRCSCSCDDVLSSLDENNLITCLPFNFLNHTPSS